DAPLPARRDGLRVVGDRRRRGQRRRDQRGEEPEGGADAAEPGRRAVRSRLLDEGASVVGILAWIVFGLLAGLVARIVTPGPHRIGCIPTVAVRVVGAFL